MEVNRYFLGMGQMLVVGGDTQGNMTRAARMIYSGAEQGCRIVVLPECLDVGWTFPTAARLAQPIPGAEMIIDGTRESFPVARPEAGDARVRPGR